MGWILPPKDLRRKDGIADEAVDTAIETGNDFSTRRRNAVRCAAFSATRSGVRI